MKKLTIGLISILAFFAHIVHGQVLESLQPQELHRAVSIQDAKGKPTLTYAKSYALVIGVSKYTNGWSDLPRVADESKHIKRMLEAQGFSVTPVDNPSGKQLLAALEYFFTEYGHGSENHGNRLLVYFSGHGHSRLDDQGYLVASDAPLPDKSAANEREFLRTAVSMEYMVSEAGKLEAKHALFIFDSCFSGTVFKVKADETTDPTIRAETAEPARQFIAAGSAREKVPAQSDFAKLFVSAIDDSLADGNRDGYVTGSELGDFLKERVPLVNRFQHPDHGWINDPRFNRGDFVFEGRQRSRDAPSAAEMWAQIEHSDRESDFMSMLAFYPNGELAKKARKRLTQLRRPSTVQLADDGGYTVVHAESTMIVKVDAPTGDEPTFVSIDDEDLMALCGDEDGCNASIGVTGWRFGLRNVEAPYFGPPCRFFLRVVAQQRHWSVAVQCSHMYATFSTENDQPVWNASAPEPFRPYFTGMWGVDGVDIVGKKDDPYSDDRMPVLVLDRACYFSETLPRSGAAPAELWPDTTAGFFLFASTFAWGGERGYPNKESWPPRATGRTCYLLIED